MVILFKIVVNGNWFCYYYNITSYQFNHLAGYNCLVSYVRSANTIVFSVEADLDECTTMRHDCSGTCVNTPGSYTCECEPGYRKTRTNGCEGTGQLLYS